MKVKKKQWDKKRTSKVIEVFKKLEAQKTPKK